MYTAEHFNVQGPGVGTIGPLTSKLLRSEEAIVDVRVFVRLIRRSQLGAVGADVGKRRHSQASAVNDRGLDFPLCLALT
jgi:hypothetical protein